MSKQLTGRRLAIVAGKTSLSRRKVEAYRKIWGDKGYDLPDWNPEESPVSSPFPKPHVREESEPVGTILARKFEFISKSSTGCSACNSLASKMNRNGADWCEENFEMIVEKIASNAEKVLATGILSSRIFHSSFGQKMLTIAISRYLRQAIAESRQELGHA